MLSHTAAAAADGKLTASTAASTAVSTFSSSDSYRAQGWAAFILLTARYCVPQGVFCLALPALA